MSDYLVSLKIQNGRIRTAMRDRGFTCAADLARASNCSQGEVGKFLNLRLSPIGKRGEYRNSVIKICEALGKTPDELFSEVQHTLSVPSNVREFLVEEYEIKQLVSNAQSDPQRLLDLKKVGELFEWPALKRLEKNVLQGIYKDGLTLDEVAVKLNYTREHIRRVRDRALSKLRHPTASEEFKEIYEEME